MSQQYILSIIIVYSIFACRNSTVENKQAEKNSIDKFVAVDTLRLSESRAKEWLIQSIENHFAKDLPDMQNMTTPQYFEYKTEATNVGYDTDGSLTEEAFAQKWGKSYEVKYAGLGVGFLISAQDWNEIKVAACNLLSKSEIRMKYQVVLVDAANKAKYKRDITVIQNGDTFLIDDVKEYD